MAEGQKASIQALFVLTDLGHGLELLDTEYLQRVGRIWFILAGLAEDIGKTRDLRGRSP